MLTCDAAVRLSAIPPVFKLIRNNIQSGSSLNLLMAISLAFIFVDPSNWTHWTPDCKTFRRQWILVCLMKKQILKTRSCKIITHLLQRIVNQIQEWWVLAKNDSFCRTISLNHKSNFFPLYNWINFILVKALTMFRETGTKISGYLDFKLISRMC